MAEVICLIDETPGARHASVTLRHAGKFNAMSRVMWRELRAVFERLQQQTRHTDPLRCVVVQSAEGHFCAGGDIAEYASFRFQEASLRQFHEEDVWGGLQAMLACDAPVIAAIDGNCMGAGVEIASCCDIRIATPESRFGAPIAKLGFPMAPREAALVTSRLGQTLARSMLLEAAVYPAAALQQAGFITRVVQPQAGALEQEVVHAVGKVLALSPATGRMHKQMLREWDSAALAAVIDAQCRHAYAYADSPEHREGIAAFTDKRSPKF